MDTITRQEADNAIKAAVEREQKTAKEREAAEVQRRLDIDAATDIATQLKPDERMAMARAAHADGSSVAVYMERLNKRIEEIGRNAPEDLNDPSKLGLSDKDTQRFSITRAVGNMAGWLTDDEAGFERETACGCDGQKQGRSQWQLCRGRS